jgi:hypothetical protein
MAAASAIARASGHPLDRQWTRRAFAAANAAVIEADDSEAVAEGVELRPPSAASDANTLDGKYGRASSLYRVPQVAVL